MRHAFACGAVALCILSSTAYAAAKTIPSHVTLTQVAAISHVRLVGQAPSPDVVQWTSAIVVSKAVAHKRALSRFASSVVARTARIAQRLTRSALRFIGVPYVFGGTSRSGFDCSGYTQHVFAMLGLHIPRTADAQYYAEHRAKGGPKAGDLVFFQTYEAGPSHVGIYLGKGRFVHASSHGVMVSSLSDSYWSARYLGAKRVIAVR
ncbi:MAG TPA: C40 family peptidase [Candidatus Baltobacteraceae bacterium]